MKTLCIVLFLYTQSICQYKGYIPLKINLTDDSSSYVKFGLRTQILLDWNNEGKRDNISLALRRIRLPIATTIKNDLNSYVLIGLSGLDSELASSKEDKNFGERIVLLEAWVSYDLIYDYLSVGAGLHYYNGLSRISSQSTSAILLTDLLNPKFYHPDLYTTSKLLRNIGIFFKGKLGRIDYRLAINDAVANSSNTKELSNSHSYKTRLFYKDFNNKGKWVFEGYFNYQFMDLESNKYSTFKTNYLGKKNIFNLGIGFLYNSEGLIKKIKGAEDIPNNITLEYLEKNTRTKDVFHFALDAYYDSPLKNKDVLNIYSTYHNFDYADDFIGKNTSSGEVFHIQIGYFFDETQIQPFGYFNYKPYKSNTEKQFGFGLNIFFINYNSKLSFENSIIDNSNNINNSLKFLVQVNL